MGIKTNKWIPVETALPELGGNHMCTIEYKDANPNELQRTTMELMFERETGRWFNEYIGEYEDDVTAWLPTITPYKGWR